METKYILVNWPDSQQFMNCEHAYFSGDFRLDDSTYFVREDLYELGINNPDLYDEELDTLLNNNLP